MQKAVRRYGRNIRLLCGGRPCRLHILAKELGKSTKETYYVWCSLGHPSSIPNKETLLLKPHKKPKAIEVTIEGMRTYPSINAAARALGCARSVLQAKVNKYGTTLTAEQAAIDIEQQERLRTIRKWKKGKERAEKQKAAKPNKRQPSVEWLSFTDRPRGL